MPIRCPRINMDPWSGGGSGNRQASRPDSVSSIRVRAVQPRRGGPRHNRQRCRIGRPVLLRDAVQSELSHVGSADRECEQRIFRLLGVRHFTAARRLRLRDRPRSRNNRDRRFGQAQRRACAGPSTGNCTGPRVGCVSADPRTYSTCITLFRDQADCAEMMRRLNGSVR
jgi:hypothetical protein